MTTNNPNFLRKEQASVFLGISLSTFDRLYHSGKIQAYTLGGKGKYFKCEDLEKMLQPETGNKTKK